MPASIRFRSRQMSALWRSGGSSTISNPCHKPCQESLRELLNSGRRSYECEHGIHTFEKATRQTLDLSAIPLLPAELHLPVVVDPSHTTGHWQYAGPHSQCRCDSQSCRLA